MADRPSTARLTITAQGATMEFRTMGLPDPAFTIRSGRSRTFSKLPPGRYVVVQAPPWGGTLQMQCSNGQTNQHDLVAGDNVSCTFTGS